MLDSPTAFPQEVLSTWSALIMKSPEERTLPSEESVSETGDEGPGEIRADGANSVDDPVTPSAAPTASRQFFLQTFLDLSRESAVFCEMDEGRSGKVRCSGCGGVVAC